MSNFKELEELEQLAICAASRGDFKRWQRVATKLPANYRPYTDNRAFTQALRNGRVEFIREFLTQGMTCDFNIPWREGINEAITRGVMSPDLLVKWLDLHQFEDYEINFFATRFASFGSLESYIDILALRAGARWWGTSTGFTLSDNTIWRLWKSGKIERDQFRKNNEQHETTLLRIENEIRAARKTLMRKTTLPEDLVKTIVDLL